MAKKKNKKQEEEELKSQENVENVNDSDSTEVDDTKETTDEPKEDVVEETLEEKLEREISEMKDKHLRLQAEFDNYRKRTLQEKSDLIKAGGESTIVNLLPVIDDFGRAMDSFEKVDSVEAMKEGLLLISNKFHAFLKQNGVSEIEAKELEFDTDKHEALTKIPAPSEDLKGKVVDVIEKGYQLHDKVIRYAKVVVGE